MLLSTKHQKVLLLLRDPKRVTQIIPTAKMQPYKGVSAVAVPWKVDETRVLRNLGFDVPSPIAQLYKWSGRYAPFAAQKDTAAFLTLNDRAFVLNEIGTGKTLSALWAYDYLRSQGLAQKLLVITPLSTLERTWADEVFQHFPHLTTSVLHGTKDDRLLRLKQDVDVYLINHDGIKVIHADLMKRKDIDSVIVDEIAAFRNSGTDRYKSLRTLVASRRRVWGMTGTPTPNAPTDAWAQCMLISPSKVPPYFGRFRDLVMHQVSMYSWVPRPQAQETVASAMQPAVRYTRDECVDLPPVLHQTRSVELTPEQAKTYNKMLRELKAEYAGGEMIAVNEGVKLSKLVQICCLQYDTPVLTNNGWVPIQQVTPDQHVWDGVEWVRHDGCVAKGTRQVVELDGVHMTPDHEVLTARGWHTAQEILHGGGDQGFARARVRLPDGAPTRREFSADERDLAVPVHVWQRGAAHRVQPDQGQPAKRQALWLHARSGCGAARTVAVASVPDLDSHTAQVYAAGVQGLAELWRAGDHSLRTVVGVVRQFLGRHVRWVQRQVVDWTHRQRRAVLAGELSVGNSESAAAQSTAPTFDLVNCGPRNRFVVKGRDGQLLIVHNCGAAYTPHGTDILIPARPRLNVLTEIIEECASKVIVFVPFVNSVQHVSAFLTANGFTTCEIHGSVSKKDRDRIYGDFQKAVNPRVLVAQPGAMSHGLTLTAASTIVWFAPITSNDIYAQANGRITRPGQTQNQLIVHIESSETERKMYRRLMTKQKMQGVLLDLIKDERITVS